MITIQGLLLLVGVGFDFSSDADHDFDLDADADVGIGIGEHADHGVFDVDSGHDGHGHDWDHDWSFGKLLSPLGVGKIPLSIIWETYFLGFGMSGFTVSFILSQFFAASFWFLLLTIPLGLVSGWHLTKLGAKLIIPLLKTSGVAESQRDIIGRTGKVTSLEVTDKWGEIALNINGSTNHMIVASDTQDLQKGEQVIVVGYDEDLKRPIISRLKA